MSSWASYIFVALFLTFGHFETVYSQVDHWETLVYSHDDWHFKIGAADISLEWKNPGFDVSEWSIGPGGFGYGDDDDATILDDVLSVFIIREFEVFDAAAIANLILHADYDDGFVAYLNGVEIARKNLGVVGLSVPYDQSAVDYIEPQVSQGLLPEAIKIEASLLTNDSNTLAIQVHNYGTNSSDLSSNFFLSAGLTDNSNDYGPTPDWFASSVFETQLPIFKINTAENAEIMNDERISAHLGVMDYGPETGNFPFGDFNGYDGAISIEYQGTSSLMFDKKGYAFETQNADGSNNNVELLGLPEENDWVLHGPYSDKSLLRNVLTYHLGNLSGVYAPRTRICELYVNDQYEGIYVLTEKIKQDANRVDIAKLTPLDNDGDELTGGYIIKIDRNQDDVPGIGWYSEFPDYKFMAFVEPQAEDITSAQEQYIKDFMYDFESAMDGSNYATVYNNYIDVASLVDYFLVTEISKQIDAFKLSFYLYKDKDSNGGKLHFGPLWDFNLAYGNFDFSCPPDYDGWAYEFPDCGSWHPFWARKLLDTPNIQHLSKCRWEELRAGPFQTLNLLSFIDSKVTEMGAATDRNFERWPVLGENIWPNDFIGEDYVEEVNFLKTWLANRLQWMDENMQGECEDYVSHTSQISPARFNVYPNPASHSLYVSFSKDEEVILEFYDLNNHLLKTKTLSPNSERTLDLSGFANGIYTVLIKSFVNGQTIFVDRLAVIKK